MTVRRRTSPRTVVGGALLLGLACTAAVATASVTVPRSLAPLSHVLVGLVTLAGAPALLLLRPAPGPLPRSRAAGVAVALLSGAGSLIVGVEQLAATSPPPYPAAGDVLGLTAVPFAVLVVLRLPRAAGDAVRLPRVLPVALFVGAGTALLAWRTVLVRDGATTDAVTAAAVAMLVATVVALLVTVAVVGRERAMAVLVVGGCLLLVGYAVASTQAVVPGDASVVLAAATLCLGWPLVWAGLLLAPAGASRLDDAARARSERRAAAVTVAAIVLAGALVLASLGPRVLDVVSIVLLNVVVAGIVAHVAVSQRQHLAQVDGLIHLADHDPLTGAGNRRALAAALAASAAGGWPVGVAVLNLDGFSAVNDRFGSSGGDAVLVAVADALRAAAPPGVAVFRLSGDAFALVGPLDGGETLAVARSARAAVAGAAAAVPGMGQVRLPSSCGVHSAPAPAGGTCAGDPMAVVDLAISALQAARKAGRDRAVVWTEDLAADDRRRDLVEARLRRALAVGDLEVHLQPVVDVATREVRGFEALSRWTDDELGPVSPVEFVAVAEATGLVVPLGRAVMADALDALVTTGGLDRSMTVAVNASPAELRREGFAASVAAALAERGVPADLLVVEVTEAIFVAADDPAVDALRALAATGVRVAVDDFGTGYSSLSYLTRLPVHELKIDRSLTCRLHEGPTRAVVTALVAMADTLGLDVVAEGVEEDAQADALAAMGVVHGQGWLWWRALPVDRVTELLAATGPACPSAPPAPAGSVAPPAGGVGAAP